MTDCDVYDSVKVISHKIWVGENTKSQISTLCSTKRWDFRENNSILLTLSWDSDNSIFVWIRKKVIFWSHAQVFLTRCYKIFCLSWWRQAFQLFIWINFGEASELYTFTIQVISHNLLINVTKKWCYFLEKGRCFVIFSPFSARFCLGITQPRNWRKMQFSAIFAII